MVGYNYQNFLSLLAKKCHALVYDDGKFLKHYKDILNTFELYRYNNINNVSVAHVSDMFISEKVDMVLIYSTDYQKVLTLCQEILLHDKNMVITVALEEHNDISLKIANLVDTIVYTPFSMEVLNKKISISLSAKFMIYEMTHTINTHKKFLDDTGIEPFLNEYQEEIKILFGTLSSVIQRLKSGELSHEFFCEMADEMELIGTIFNYHHYTARVSLIFNQMAAFLRIYSFDDIDVRTLEGFDYLVEILQDICNYMNDFFIKRIFSDVYVFEHSLLDSINFMINRLNNNEDIKSKLEFF